MFCLPFSTQARLSPEAREVAETFLAALPPYATRSLRSVRLFGPQARRFDPEAAFLFLVLADARSPEVRSAVVLGTAAVEAGELYRAEVTVTTPGELEQATPALARLLANARREGVDLWVREPAFAIAG